MMNDFDKLIEEKIKIEYSNIEPDEKALERIRESVTKTNKTESNVFRKYGMAVAAVIIVMMIAVNTQSIKAFVVNLYQKYIADINKNYDEDMDAYQKKSQWKIDTDEGAITINRYVVTNLGIDFKISVPSEEINLVGCEITIGDETLVQEAIVQSQGYYIASNVFKDSKWKEQNSSVYGKVTLLYLDKNGLLITKDKEITIDLSDKYYVKKIENKNGVLLSTKQYEVNSISFGTWYMKVVYRMKDKEWDGSERIAITQHEKEVLYLTTSGEAEEMIGYYQLPDLDAPLYIGLAHQKINEEGTYILVSDEKEKIELKKYMEEK